MAESKKKPNKPTFTFREPTPKELKEMYPDDMAREAVEDAKEKKEKRRKKVEKMKAGGALKAPANPGLKKLPTKVRNKMGYMKAGGKVTSKCKRDGIAIRGRTKGRMVQNE